MTSRSLPHLFRARSHLLLRSQIRNPKPSSLPLKPLQRFCSSDASPPPPPPPTTQTPKVKIAGGGGVNPSPLYSSLDADEVAKFASIAETWWDFEGPFKPLHLINPPRLSFIRSTFCRHFRRDPYCARPFEGLKFIDVGCGGGILSEPLARMGAMVTGIDAVEKNIKIARVHAGFDPLTSSIDYSCTTAEQLVRENKMFDAVLALEVIEHVADPSEFCKSLAALTAPNGATVISTINRSVRSYAAAIVAAEYLLKWIPRGTHEWSKFLSPEELVMIMRRSSISVSFLHFSCLNIC
ncbi:uncharacterized protein A4U43_C06F13350 [Asparagus officinalis]|uniref:Ubiquinone biosynthesis O-methyltransferase, mitochondrial n=1 Tax=Asparagus officinalis TaxID=4686 RepID=A0A5P1EP29_ASPOF|nr:uncharacterized protein A4U43_C06F13350 [Asparagus officinalis]